MIGSDEPVLTLEPFIAAVRDGVEGAGWTLSGLQKTTSHEYEGRWRGESSRSAFLFFHRPAGDDGASIESFIDETSRGAEGNLSLVLEGPPLERLGDARSALAAVASAAHRRLPGRARVSLKLRLDDAGEPVARAATEIRVKVAVGEPALRAGVAAVAEVAASAVRSFERLLEDPELRPYSDGR